MHEFQLIDRIKKKIPRALQGIVPIGDDTAVLPAPSPKERLLFTSGAIVDGVDFILSKTPAEKIGRKALAINLSDIAAMGGTPVAALVTLGIPRGSFASLRMTPSCCHPEEAKGRRRISKQSVSFLSTTTVNEPWILKFYEGMIPLAKKYGVLMAGGDISSSPIFFASFAAGDNFLARFCSNTFTKKAVPVSS